MNGADTVSMLAAMMSAFPSAVVSISVQLDPNTTAAAQGIRTNKTIARAIAKGGMSNNTDTGVWCAASAFPNHDALPGKVATITDASGVVTTGRLLPVRVHALGGLINLSIGELDRVAQ